MNFDYLEIKTVTNSWKTIKQLNFKNNHYKSKNNDINSDMGVYSVQFLGSKMKFLRWTLGLYRKWLYEVKEKKNENFDNKNALAKFNLETNQNFSCKNTKMLDYIQNKKKIKRQLNPALRPGFKTHLLT